jgi:hypothetical protein
MIRRADHNDERETVAPPVTAGRPSQLGWPKDEQGQRERADVVTLVPEVVALAPDVVARLAYHLQRARKMLQQAEERARDSVAETDQPADPSVP